MTKQTQYEHGETCEECMEYDGMCRNQASDHYQHMLGMNHPACDEMVKEITCD